MNEYIKGVIDGGHEYKDVLNDWGNYSVFLSNDSVIGFHDIIAYEGVNKAWKEICSENSNYSFSEFKEPGIPLLKNLVNDGIEKFKKNITLGVGYLFKK